MGSRSRPHNSSSRSRPPASQLVRSYTFVVRQQKVNPILAASWPDHATRSCRDHSTILAGSCRGVHRMAVSVWWDRSGRRATIVGRTLSRYWPDHPTVPRSCHLLQTFLCLLLLPLFCSIVVLSFCICLCYICLNAKQGSKTKKTHVEEIKNRKRRGSDGPGF